MKERGDLLQGTLDMLVLKALQLEPMHGWGITERIEQWSEQVLQLGQGTLYPALYRLERQGLIRSEWQVTENSRRARYYSLTRQGRQRLDKELAKATAELERYDQKLANPKFLERAPAEVVDEQRLRRAEAEQTRQKLAAARARIAS